MAILRVLSRIPVASHSGRNLGALLFLVYHDLSSYLSSDSARMFADDTIITNAASTIADFENVVNSELRKLNCWPITK